MPKSILEPVQTISFMGVEIDSVNMSMNLPLKKTEKNRGEMQKGTDKTLNECVGTEQSGGKTILNLPSGHSSKLTDKIMQKCLIKALQLNISYQAVVHLDPQALWEIRWWLNNLALNQGRSLLKSL